MRFRSVALMAFALLFFGTPVRADEVVVTPASPGVDIDANEDSDIDVTFSAPTMTGAQAWISSGDFARSATAAPYSDAGISLSRTGGLSAGDLQGITAVTGNPGAGGQPSPSGESGMPAWFNGGGSGRKRGTTPGTGTTPH